MIIREPQRIEILILGDDRLELVVESVPEVLESVFDQGAKDPNRVVLVQVMRLVQQ
jgi:hypothetical protein